MVFGNGVKNIQAAAYNGARTVSSMQEDKTINFKSMLTIGFYWN